MAKPEPAAGATQSAKWELIFVQKILHEKDCEFESADEDGYGHAGCDCYVLPLWKAIVEEIAKKPYTQADLDFFSANADEYFEMANALRSERDRLRRGGRSMASASDRTLNAATGRPVTPTGPHRDDVLLGKVMRVRARIDLVARTNATSSFETELRLLDEVIEELTLDDD